MKLFNSILILLFVLALSASETQAQSVQTQGPFAGAVKCFAVSGTKIFAGISGGGVFLSTDNGGNWTAVNSGLTNKNIKALAASGASLFAGTLGGGIFRSTNNGKNWTVTDSGLVSKNVFALVIRDGNLFAATDNWVFISTDNGAYWSQMNAGLAIVPLVSALIVTGKGLYVASAMGGFFCTEAQAAGPGGLPPPVITNFKSGSTWTAVNSGLTHTSVSALVISGEDVFAGTSRGVFLCTDKGTTWTTVNTGLTNKFVSPIFKRLESFERQGVDAGLTIPEVSALAVSGRNIFAGTDGGVFLSSNNGASWAEAGLTGVPVTSLAVSDTNIFAGTYGNIVFLSTDNGTSWTRVNRGLDEH